MDQLPTSPEERVRRYLSGKRNIEQRRLGSGTDGDVFIVTGPQAAIKVHFDEHRFFRELVAYERLAELGIDQIGAFVIPKFHNADTKLLIIEMSVVRPPFLIDFGKATVDDDQGWPKEQMQMWWDRVNEVFDQDASIASSVFTQLRDKTGIYQWDLNPANLNFGPLSKNED
jgi:hypothetical protein